MESILVFGYGLIKVYLFSGFVSNKKDTWLVPCCVLSSPNNARPRPLNFTIKTSADSGKTRNL